MLSSLLQFIYREVESSASFEKLVRNFFVGVSAESILTLGAASQEYTAEDAVINRVHYKLELSRSRDGKSIRTFYPIYVPS